MNEKEIAAGLAPTPGYRYADEVGGRLYVAGQVPLDATGDLVGVGEVERQVEACLSNLESLLRVHGYERAEIRHLTLYVVGDQPTLAAAWSAARGWFAGEVPPATLLGVSALGHRGQLVEVDAVIVRSGQAVSAEEAG